MVRPGPKTHWTPGVSAKEPKPIKINWSQIEAACDVTFKLATRTEIENLLKWRGQCLVDASAAWPHKDVREAAQEIEKAIEKKASDRSLEIIRQAIQDKLDERNAEKNESDLDEADLRFAQLSRRVQQLEEQEAALLASTDFSEADAKQFQEIRQELEIAKADKAVARVESQSESEGAGF